VSHFDFFSGKMGGVFIGMIINRYIIYAIKDEKQIVVEKVGDRNANYQDFVQDLLAAGPDDCRYGVFDYEYEHLCQGATTGSQKQKLILLSW
jgi:cofilin